VCASLPLGEARNSRMRWVLPIPASPSISTIAGGVASARPSAASSRSRPTRPGLRMPASRVRRYVPESHAWPPLAPAPRLGG
jgi:hypothetical protein